MKDNAISQSQKPMPQSFFLVRLRGIKGPITFSKVLDLYYDGQLHDTTPVWDSVHRHWYQFAKLKLPLVMTLQPETVVWQVQVAWVTDGTGFEPPADVSKGMRRGGSRLFRGFARQTTRWRSGAGLLSWFG
jgi:hypothetical protein